MQEQTAIVVLRNKQNYKDTPYRDEGVWGCFLYISYFIQPNGTFLNVESFPFQFQWKQLRPEKGHLKYE